MTCWPNGGRRKPPPPGGGCRGCAGISERIPGELLCLHDAALAGGGKGGGPGAGGGWAYTFAIVLKDTGKAIDEIDAHPESSQPDTAENFVQDTFSPCWMLNRDCHGKGYAFEAARAFFGYLFREKGARRICANTGDCNKI